MDKTYIERNDFSDLPRGFFDIPLSENPTYLGVGSISNYEPTPRQKLAYFLNRTIFSDDRAGQDRAEFLLRPIDVSPAAIPFAAYDATRAIGEGAYKDAILPSITVAAPFIGRLAKMLPGEKRIGPGDSVIENFPSSANGADSSDGMWATQNVQDMSANAFNPPSKQKAPFEVDYNKGIGGNESWGQATLNPKTETTKQTFLTKYLEKKRHS